MADLFSGNDHRWLHIKTPIVREGQNLNGLVFDREFLKNHVSDWKSLPVNIQIDENGKPAGHTWVHPVGTVLDAEFVEADEEGKAGIDLTLGVWRHRFPKVAEAVSRLFRDKALKFSMELKPWSELADHRTNTVKPVDATFTGLSCVLTPAEPKAVAQRLGELSAAFYDDLETNKEVPSMDLTDIVSAVRGLFKEELSSYESDKIIESELVGAEWTREFIDSLPNAAFAYIDPKGGRHFPHHTADVKSADEKETLDMPHLRNAISRMSQSPMGDMAKAHLQMHEKQMGMGMMDPDKAKEKQADMEELNRLQVANEEIAQKLSSVETERDTATQKITELTASVSEKDEKLSGLSKELGELTASLEEANKRATSLESELSEFKNKVAKEETARERMAEIEAIKPYDLSERKEKLAMFAEMKDEEFKALRDERAKGVQLGTFNNGDTEETELQAARKELSSKIDAALEARGLLNKES